LIASSTARIKSMFSSGAIILSKRRNRLADDIFEKLLILKLNQILANW